MHDKLIRYEELKRFQKSINDELTELNKEILEEFQRTGAQKSKELEHGVIVLCTKKVWKYSNSVKELEGKVKELKDDEMARGIATYNNTEYLVYKEKSTGSEE